MRIYFTAFCLAHLTMGSSSEFITPSHHRDLENRVIGGTVADPQRFPYYTLLKTFTKSGTGSSCGGTLIAPDVIMTAAHCVEGSDDFFGDSSPVLGVDAFVNSTTIQYSKYEHYRTGIKWIVHPDRNEVTNKNDVALIFLDAPVIDVPMVKLNKDVNIPASNDPTPLTLIGLGVEDVNATFDPSFGSFTIYTYADKLRKLVTDTVPIPSCTKTYTSFYIGDSNICAGGKGVKEGSCFGDSGGPLLKTKSSANQDVQIAIASWVGSRDCSGASPDVYARVSYFAG